MSPRIHRSRRTARLHLLAALFAVLALIGVACGDDDDTDVVDGGDPAADATPTPEGEVVEETPTPEGDAEATPTPAVEEETPTPDDAGAEETPTPATDEEATDGEASGDDVTAELAQVLRDNGLSSLATAVEQVDLSSVIGEEFTFFAPSDEAFLALGAEDTAEILTDPGRLVDVLSNHVLDTRVGSEELATMDSVESRLGETVTVTVDGDTVMVGDATVTTADLDVGGGVIHIVDRVLLP